jgi:RNA polymerase sigma-70 factor (ECF subfamily)
MPASDDNHLVRRARAGDLAAFEELVSRHERRVYGLALRLTGSVHDAQDVTQQTFLSALENLSGFRGAAAFATWLTRIAAHAALRLLRKRRGLPSTSLEAATEPGPDGEIPHPEFIADWRESPDRLAQRTETRRLLDEAMARLPPGQRTVFLLRDVEGLSVADTARTLGLSQANVKVRLLRARLALREQLTRAFGDPARRLAPADHAGHGHAGILNRKEHAHAPQAS